MVLAELAGVVAEIEQELGERRRAGPQIGRAAGQLRRDHAGAQRIHAGEEGIAARRAALLGVIVHELRTFVADAIDVGRFPDHQAAMVDARLHPADVVAHDEEDVRLAAAVCAAAGVLAGPDNASDISADAPSSARTPARTPSCAGRRRCPVTCWSSMQSDMRLLLRWVRHQTASRLTHRKPTWLVDVSTSSAWRAAGR